MQQWANTFFSSGHSIVPCEIPAYTLLYHGLPSDDMPASPEFVSFDIEMAYAIMGNLRNSHILTYQTTRAVKVLYFDGQSAALMGNGAMDAQMVFLYGNTSGPVQHPGRMLGDEYARAYGLCNWALENDLGGLGWGIEGIVRMNAGFEMMWCNFSSPSLRLITQLNVSAPLLPDKRNLTWATSQSQDDAVDDTKKIPSNTPLPLPTMTVSEGGPTASGPPEFSLPENWRDLQLREPFLYAAGWEWFRSTSWQYGTSGVGKGKGEERVKPLACGFMSFYDLQFPSRAIAISSLEKDFLNLTSDGLWIGPGTDGDRSIALKQLSRRRRYHNLHSIDSSEAIKINDQAKVALTNLNQTSPSCSGLDWTALTSEIIQRYSKPLVELSTFLSTFEHSTNQTELSTFFYAARIRSHALLVPFLEYPDSKSNPSTTWSMTSPLAHTAQSRCTYRYTRLLHPTPPDLSPSESLLLNTTEEVMTSICNTLISVGFSLERIWFTHFDTPTLSTSIPKDLTPEIIPLSSSIDTLLAWLGWTPFLTTCNTPCQWDETCHIPIWPLADMFAPAPPSPPSNDTVATPPGDHRGGPGRRPPWDHGNGTHGGSPGRGGGTGRGSHPGYGGPPGWDRGNRSVGHGGMDNLPPHTGGGPGFGGRDLEDGLWEPRCMKVQDMHRAIL